MLTGDQVNQFTSALLDAFPSQAKLAEMVRLKLDKNLHALALGDNLQEIVFRLIGAAEAEGWIAQLIFSAHTSNPGNPVLLEFFHLSSGMLTKGEHLYETASGGDEQRVLSYQLPSPCNFDLTRLIEDSLEKVEGKHGLIGLAVPCDDDAFLENFGERLKKELGRRNIQMWPRLTLKPIHVSTDEAIAIIKRCKQVLQKRDILYPIVIHIFDKHISNAFWQTMCHEFTGNFENRLIVIMGGDSACAFPDDIPLLEPPQFREAHIITWVRDVVGYLGWPDNVREVWKQKMVAECSYNNMLHMRFVYEHLVYTLQLLQGNLSCERFLDELEQRSLYCD